MLSKEATLRALDLMNIFASKGCDDCSCSKCIAYDENQ